MGINRLRMTSGKDKSTTVSIQLIDLLDDVVSVLDVFRISSFKFLLAHLRKHFDSA
jgi:hypothetical protein